MESHNLLRASLDASSWIFYCFYIVYVLELSKIEIMDLADIKRPTKSSSRFANALPPPKLPLTESRSTPLSAMEMKMAVSAANWLVGKVLSKLSDGLVSTYMASSELGRNFLNAKNQLQYTQGLLSASVGRDVGDDPGLRGLLGMLSKKADEAEDVLDELHYFIIQDEIDGTKEAAAEVGGGIKGHSVHGRHVARYTLGNCLPCFSSPRTQGDEPPAVAAAAAAVATSNDDGDVDIKLPFNRVALSKKIKSVIEEMNSIRLLVSDLLKTANHNSTPLSTHVTIERPPTGSIVPQDRKLYGRSDIFEQTVNALTSGTYHDKTLSVLPFVGPGGIGKTTFTQHLYNDEKIKGHFPVRVWVCVSTNFDVIRLTREILGCISGTNANTYETQNLDQLQRAIAEKLDSKRFLIILDDVWTCKSERDWENLLAPFTTGGTKGSMVLVTTRLPSVAHMVKTTDPVQLRGLEPDDFFAMFEACIFGHNKPRVYEDDLVNVARDIAKKLKGSPLAANTVGRLLKKNISWEYWMGILEKNEWQSAKNDDDILPSLQISYNYLPFHLQKCFFYCALFPEDYKFYDLEKITNFWIAMGIVDSYNQNDKNYLDELVENGFLIKDSDWNGEYYVMHDLLHELSRNVSSQECVNISSLSFRANDIPQSIRHLSITVEDKYDESFGQELCELKSVIDIGNLRTLMIFGLHNSEKEFHSSIPEVGKMKWLQELREFHVKKESVGFELSQLGELTELGQLGKCNLETVASKQEANDAKLKDKRNLKELELVWGAGQQITDGDVIEGLQPPPNLRGLGIINYGFTTGPSWLCSDISIKRLGSLHLKGISWDSLPPFEQLPHLTNIELVNIAGMRMFGPGFGGLTETSFMHLKTIEIWDMLELEEWVEGPNSPLFPRLESIVCEDCPLLSSFSFLECCTNLCQLFIEDCPELSQLPALPHTSTLTGFSVYKGFSRRLTYDGKCLSADGYMGALAFQNMDKVEDIVISESPHVSLSVSDLQKMNSLRRLVATGCGSMFSAEWFNPVVLEDLAAHDKSFDEKNISVAAGLIPEVAMSKSLHPSTFQLEQMEVENIPAVLIAPICRRLAATLHKLKFCGDLVTETITEEQEQALNLLTSLRILEFTRCKLRSLPRLYGFSSLYKFSIARCDEIQSLPSKEDLPASLLALNVSGCSREIKEQAKKLKEANPCLFVRQVGYLY
ncbi:disease resistance protein RGA2-like [Triticum dicoccoides]|uniref:disease resistance protein RGA2-like n=1 Tax=Triticum dicoccoides TaxID=85692 RepID=UPI00188FAC8D|nr:disease resistance protein RGA2-like [Triticum dicoccoides]